MRCLLILCLLCLSCKDDDGFNKLTPDEYYILVEKGTEKRYSGKYNDFYEEGIYQCKRCDSVLFLSETKFDSKSGWPSFDESIPDRVKRKNPQKKYTEITCMSCSGHLGHVMTGEGFTPKDTRYCVNSLALKFVPKTKKRDSK